MQHDSRGPISVFHKSGPKLKAILIAKRLGGLKTHMIYLCQTEFVWEKVLTADSLGLDSKQTNLFYNENSGTPDLRKKSILPVISFVQGCGKKIGVVIIANTFYPS